MDFKNGDFIKGKINNPYSVTNKKMEKGVVLNAEEGKSMKIKILEHRDESQIGNTYYVSNTFKCFELLSREVTKKELLDMPLGTKIIVDSLEDNVYVKISPKKFKSENGCTIDDYEIENDLTFNNKYCKTRIIKIEEPIYKPVYEYSNKAIEMTIAEIEEKLGYSIKIVKEETE